jgi:hypothetical protein
LFVAIRSSHALAPHRFAEAAGAECLFFGFLGFAPGDAREGDGDDGGGDRERGEGVGREHEGGGAHGCTPQPTRADFVDNPIALPQ